MYDWTVLNQAVYATLASGRVGAPVFVRWTASVARSKDDLKALLVEMSAYTGLWLAASPRQLYAAGAESQGHLSLALDYDNGSSALLALTLAHGQPSMDLAIYSANGAIYHRDMTALSRAAIGEVWEGDDPSQPATWSTADALDALDRSLAGNQPVSLSHFGVQQ